MYTESVQAIEGLDSPPSTVRRERDNPTAASPQAVDHEMPAHLAGASHLHAKVMHQRLTFRIGQIKVYS